MNNLNQDGQWRTLPRTEAAARSGMALFGLNGLTPRATMLSADNSTVRTIYTMESGETVELTQQKTGDQKNAFSDTSTSVTATAPTVDVQNARQARVPEPSQTPAPAPAGAAPASAPAPPAPAPPVWSQIRGDVRLTLRGTANADAVAQRLRLD